MQLPNSSDNSLQVVTIPRVMVCGLRPNSGVSTITLGILAALRQQNVSIAPALVGCRLIQATHYRRVSGRLCHSLQPWLLSEGQLRDSIGKVGAGSEIVIIEGEQGMFDQLPPDYCVQNEAALAKLLSTPIILVIEAGNYKESLIPVIKGVVDYDPELTIAGVILNKVNSKEAGIELGRKIEATLGVPFLGAIPVLDSLAGNLPQEANPSLLSRSVVYECGEAAKRFLNLKKIKEAGESAETISVRKSILGMTEKRCRIAVSEDMAFHLTFQANLDLLRRYGAELVAVSPLLDRKLPDDIDAIYLASGYVDLYAGELANNKAMCEALVNFARAGGLIYAEGNSIAYLCRSLMLSGGQSYQLSGVLPARATILADRSEHPELADFRASDDLPLVEIQSLMPSVLLRDGDICRGVRDYRWAIRLEGQVATCLEIYARDAMLSQSDDVNIIEGLQPSPNVLATSIMTCWASNPKIAEIFVDKAIEFRRARVA